MNSDDREPARSVPPESPRRLTLTDSDIEVVDVASGRSPVMAASQLEVMTFQPIDHWDIGDYRIPDSDLKDANKDIDGHDGDAFKWP